MLIRNNKFYITVILIFVILFCCSIVNKYYNVIAYRRIYENAKYICNSVLEEGSSNFCTKVINENPDPLFTKLGTTPTIFINVVSQFHLHDIWPIIIIIVTSVILHKSVKNKMSLFCLQRENYKSFIIKNIKKMYKIAFCLPISFIIFSIICYFFNDSNINIDLTSGLSSLSKLHLNMGVWFCIIYSINILLLSISICNLVIIIGKKSFNVFITIIGTYLTYFISKLILAQVVPFITYIFLFKIDLFNALELNSFYFYDYACEFYKMFFIALTILGITSISVYMLYKNKEELIKSNETLI